MSSASRTRPTRPTAVRQGGGRASGPAPLQNRVLPTGEIVADPSRGLLMGNRGCIHNPDRRLGASRWRTKMWISCVLQWRNVRRDVMPPGRWTALFFLDEATALAAGHRPCGYCRRADFFDFCEAWRRAEHLSARLRAGEMDIQLHAERVDRHTRRQVTRPARIAELPDGVMVRHDGQLALLNRRKLLGWSLSGYGDPVEVSAAETVELLTPPLMVAVIAAGYRPLVHPTARPTSLRALTGPARGQ
jgi:hypothetical protein